MQTPDDLPGDGGQWRHAELAAICRTFQVVANHNVLVRAWPPLMRLPGAIVSGTPEALVRQLVSVYEQSAAGHPHLFARQSHYPFYDPVPTPARLLKPHNVQSCRKLSSPVRAAVDQHPGAVFECRAHAFAADAHELHRQQVEYPSESGHFFLIYGPVHDRFSGLAQGLSTNNSILVHAAGRAVP